MVICAILGTNNHVHAQATTNKTQPKPKPVVTTTPKPETLTIMPDTIKVPRFTTRFGPYNGTLPAPASDLKKIVGSKLIIADERGQQWTPVAWRFIWIKKEFTDDTKTGKRKTIMTPNIVEIDANATLPLSWQNELTEFLQSGEEIIFERIIIEHPGSKRKMLAKDLQIRII
jgi:hypothetical protein